MTPDEARKLVGGYATGSLTEAERTALFQAALEDQDLFDQLAEEQVLKEVLDEPGARQRLLAALEPSERKTFWAMRMWAAAAALLALVLIVQISIHIRQPAPPPQVAQVMKSPEPVAQLPAPAQPPKPKVAQTPAAEPSVELKKDTNSVGVDQIQENKPQAAAGAVRQFAAARVASVFGFDYRVRDDGFLVITPTAFGYLSVTADDTVIAPSALVNAGTAVRIAIPPGASSLVISFSMTPGITGTPVRRDGASGTVTDQDPPNGKILIQLSLKPATR